MKKLLPIYLLNFLLAVSTTIGMTIVPLLATEKLGMSLLVLGIIEGGSELVSNLLRLVTGGLFDKVKNRRAIFVIPPVFAFIAKVLLYSPGAVSILVSKVAERIGNGMFAAPRDAFVGENSKAKGKALGWLNVTKTFGCVVGPILVSLYVLLIGPINENIINIILLACVINFLCIVIAFFIKATKRISQKQKEVFELTKAKQHIKSLTPLLVLSFFFFLGRFNDGLILIFLKKQGFPEWYYLATISIFNTIMLLVSPFMGHWIDKGKERFVLVTTLITLLAFNVLFFNLSRGAWVIAGLGLIMWGVQRAGAQITFTAMIFKNIPTNYYGTAVGAYSIVSGIGTFISSLICGYLAADSFTNVFIFSGAFSVIALIFYYSRP